MIAPVPSVSLLPARPPKRVRRKRLMLAITAPLVLAAWIAGLAVDCLCWAIERMGEE